MPTINQLVRKPRRKKNTKVVKLALKFDWNSLRRKTTKVNKPFSSGVVKSVITLNPKKPNSAKRSCVRVMLKNRKEIVAYIPGEKHSLQEHSLVVVKGGGAKDLPGVKYSVVRGVYDEKGVMGRKTARSIYGTKKDK